MDGEADIISMYMNYSKNLLGYTKQPFSYERIKKWVSLMLVDDNFEWDIIKANEEIIGFVIISHSVDFNTDVYIEDVYIEPKYRRQGLATKHVVKKIEEHKNETIGLSVLKNNMEGISFWLNLFKSIGVLPEITESCIGDSLYDMKFIVR